MGNTTKIKHSLNMDLPLLKQELERQRLNNLPRGLIKTKFKPITNKNKLEERLIKVISLRRIALEDNNSKMLKYYNDKIEHLKLYMSIKCKKYKNSIVGLK